MENNEDQAKELLSENLQLTKEIYEMTKDIKRYVSFQKVLSVIYLLLFVVPLILGMIYIPKFLGDYLAVFQDLLGGGAEMNGFDNAQNILNEAQKLLNNN